MPSCNTKNYKKMCMTFFFFLNSKYRNEIYNTRNCSLSSTRFNSLKATFDPSVRARSAAVYRTAGPSLEAQGRMCGVRVEKIS